MATGSRPVRSQPPTVPRLAAPAIRSGSTMPTPRPRSSCCRRTTAPESRWHGDPGAHLGVRLHVLTEPHERRPEGERDADGRGAAPRHPLHQGRDVHDVQLRHRILAGAIGDVESQVCDVPVSAKFWRMTMRAHKQAAQLSVIDGGTPVFTGIDWNHPGATTWTAPSFFTFMAGGTRRPRTGSATRAPTTTRRTARSVPAPACRPTKSASPSATSSGRPHRSSASTASARCRSRSEPPCDSPDPDPAI